MIINGATVNSAFANVADSVLYAGAIFIPNQTYSNKFQRGQAGEVLVSKFKGTGSTEVSVVGKDFSGTDYANELISIPMNNSFQKEYKIRQVAANAVPLDLRTEAVINITEEQREGWEKSGIANLVDNGTASSVTDAITSSNIKSVILKLRSEVVTKKGLPNVCLCSVDTYATILEFAGKEFIPMFNEDVNRQGRVGTWLGILFIEANYLNGTGTYKYITAENTVKEVDTSNVDMVMYDYRAFSILELLNTLRIIDSENFVGSKVQSDITCGFKVTNSDCVVVKSHE